MRDPANGNSQDIRCAFHNRNALNAGGGLYARLVASREARATADMDDAAHIEERLRAWLGNRTLEHFAVLASGWETTVFELRLTGTGHHPEIPSGVPMVLRLYQRVGGAAKGAREHHILTGLTGMKFPVPRPYLFEPDPDPLGAPFLMMDRLAGGPLLQPRGFIHASRCFLAGFLPFVRTHALLHRIDPHGIELSAPSPLLDPGPGTTPESLPQRMLATIARRIVEGPLPWLRPALEWARDHACRHEPEIGSILHLDYHPLNVIVRGTRLLGVIDWVSADVGDSHLDVATTAAIISSTAMEQPRWMGCNRRGDLLRRFYASLYIALYHSQTRLDFRRLRYYQALAALLRLSTLGMMLLAGAESVGYRTGALREVTPAGMELLARYAHRKSGIPVRVDLPALV